MDRYSWKSNARQECRRSLPQPHGNVFHRILNHMDSIALCGVLDERRTHTPVTMAHGNAGSTHGSLIAGLLYGVRHRMMPQITGHIHVGTGRTHSSNKESPEPGSTATVLTGTSRSPQTCTQARVRQRASYSTGEITQRHRFGKTPHTPKPTGCSASDHRWAPADADPPNRTCQPQPCRRHDTRHRHSYAPPTTRIRQD